jgi:hypothetical protein
MKRDKVEEFLRYVREGSESAALLAPKEDYEQALEVAQEHGYGVTDIYQTAIDLLAQGESVALKIGKGISSEIYDLIRQYSCRKGLVQVLPTEGRALSLLQLDTRKTKLLLVVDAEHERRNLEVYPELLDMVGMVERL